MEAELKINSSTQLYFNYDNGQYYRIREKYGETKRCSIGGQLTKPFNPNLTGRYPFKTRLLKMKEQYPDERNQDLIELPLKVLGSNEKNNYSPQPFKLDGYSHMPR